MESLAGKRRALRVRHVRAGNRAAVLQLLRRHRRLSRAEMARRSGLSEAAVSRIVAELLEEEVLVEKGGEDATGGRPGIRLEFNEKRFQSVGVEIENWETRISLGTITGRVLETERLRTPSGPDKTLEMIAAQLEGRSGITGVGVSARGLVNSETGVAELGNDPAWVRVPIKEHLSARLQRPIFVENNVRAAALAEYHFGGLEVQGSHCLLLVKVGSGIGMGIVLDGKLYRGPRMAAGEFGQMIIADCAGPERHDHPGCVEMLAADPATCDRYRRLAGVRSRGNLGDSTEQVKRICQLAVSGDEAARQAVLGTARYLGVAIANAVWALDADAVVIDGALTEAWTLAAPAIREQFPDSRRFPNFRNLMLRPSSLRGEAVILGAISLPFTPLFSGA